eukprot:5146535-Pyramimonas_sp.AAC.1
MVREGKDARVPLGQPPIPTMRADCAKRHCNDGWGIGAKANVQFRPVFGIAVGTILSLRFATQTLRPSVHPRVKSSA